MTRRIDRNQDGSIVIVVSVVFIASALIVMLLDVAYGGLRGSRRFGDSANALQVADAGVNDAVGEVAKQPPGQSLGYTFTRTGGIGDGSYTYDATLDEYQVSPSLTAPVWHVDARGTDARGVERRVKADAVAEPMFSQAIFSKGSGVFGTGLAVDSFRSGETVADTCVGHGIVGSNDPQQLRFGGGTGNPSGPAHVNCDWMPTPGAWPVDACIAYYTPENLASGAYPPNSGTAGHCPTIRSSPGIFPGTWKASPLWKPPGVAAPGGVPLESTRTCDGSNPLVAGRVYYVTTFNMRNGCKVSGGDPRLFTASPPQAAEPGAAKVFVAAGGLADLGGNGANALLNEPPSSQPASNPCGPTGQLSSSVVMGSGSNALARTYFCPGWSRTLQIYVVGNGRVKFTNNGMKLWAVISVPNGTTEFSAPTIDVWGALISGSAGGSGSTNSPQWRWHYDEGLASMLTGRYFLANWRECPTTSTNTC